MLLDRHNTVVFVVVVAVVLLLQVFAVILSAAKNPEGHD